MCSWESQSKSKEDDLTWGIMRSFSRYDWILVGESIPCDMLKRKCRLKKKKEMQKKKQTLKWFDIYYLQRLLGISPRAVRHQVDNNCFILSLFHL